MVWRALSSATSSRNGPGGNRGLLEGERWLLLDEIQVGPGWERFVRRVVEDHNARLVVTGSSAKMLSREIATSLRGRAPTHELMPFSFAEALEHAGVGVPTTWPAAAGERATLRSAFDRYFESGGYPEVQGLDADLRRRILRDYADVALLRDVIERHSVSNVAALRALHRRLLLEGDGADVLLDQRDSPVGEDWIEWMTRGIEGADFIVIVRSAGWSAALANPVGATERGSAGDSRPIRTILYDGPAHQGGSFVHLRSDRVRS